MTTRLLVGDVFQRMAELPDHSFDLIVTSPPFLCLRSYLPDDHPDKDLEIGSEATPADYLDTLLRVSAEWRRLLAPHGSLAVELGDTYAGSGGGGGDYLDGGWREGQQQFSGSGASMRESNAAHWRAKNRDRDAWPLDKSLTGIPTLYAWSLAYGRNLLTGAESPAGRWRVRNVKPWIRSNPPVGALSVGARGVHIRRALTEAGLLPPGDYYDVSPRGYAGSHYAVFPPELVKLLVSEMCPPGGTVLDPFVGSGTTLMVCSGMGRNSVGIDLDERNVDLAVERCGMFLEVDYGLKAAT